MGNEYECDIKGTVSAENEEIYNAEAQKDYEEGEVKFRDHHSLREPSSSLTFKKSEIQIYPQRNSEFILQRKGNEFIARVGKDGSVGLSALRAIYTVNAIFMMGIILVFCLQLILFLFLGLTINMGLTSTGVSLDLGDFLGTLLSVPLFVFSLASLMALAAAFVGDSWNGHSFLNHATKLRGVAMEWISLAMFIVIPMLVAIIFLFGQNDEWWAYTILTWFCCVFALFSFFSIFVLFYEIAGTFELIRKFEHYTEIDYNTSIFDIAKYAILLRQIQRYSGRENITFSVDAHSYHSTRDGLNQESETAVRSKSMSLYSKFTTWEKLQKWGLVEKTVNVRQYSIDEVRDVAPFITSSSWSLEKLFCRSRNKMFIAVVNGKNALTPIQLRSSFLCNIMGNVLIILLLGAFLHWLALGIGASILFIILVAFLMGGPIYLTYKNYLMVKGDGKKKEDDENNEIIYDVRESYRVNKITPAVVWTIFALEIAILYIWPTIILFVIGNIPIASFFMMTGFISLIRYYFNAPSVLQEVGSISILDEEVTKSLAADTKAEREVIRGDFYEKSRLNMIIGKVSHGNRRNVWMYTFIAVVGIFCSLFLGAYVMGSSEGHGEIEGLLDMNDFVYEPKHKLPYPTCRMGSDVAIPGEEDTALADYAYLSVIAYTDSDATGTNNSTQEQLDVWFGKGFAVDEKGVVEDYRKETKIDSSVQFKLISFPSRTNFTVLAVRGTNNGWDALSDAQLWSAAWLSQALRFILPFGELWNPILENLIYFVSALQSTRLKKVAYYQPLAKFVRHLKEEGSYDGIYSDLRITGHSLGGGLAMIAGAQTGTPAIGLSGPNNMLSRLTFKPRITKEQLDEFTFNIIPDKDPVPRIDDRAELYQRIHCRASDSNFADCHTSTRSLCEILSTCGNNPNGVNKRPLFCFCHDEFGYDKPRQIGDKTYESVCDA